MPVPAPVISDLRQRLEAARKLAHASLLYGGSDGVRISNIAVLLDRALEQLDKLSQPPGTPVQGARHESAR